MSTMAGSALSSILLLPCKVVDVLMKQWPLRLVFHGSKWILSGWVPRERVCDVGGQNLTCSSLYRERRSG